MRVTISFKGVDFFMLTSACKDAVRATVWLATKPHDEYYRIQQIADSLDLPFFFLSKTFQKLVKAGIVASTRGPRGGVRLALAPERIRVLEIVEAVDGSAFFDACVLGIGACESETPCALHAQWDTWREEMKVMLDAMRLSELVDDVGAKKIKRL